MRLHIIRHGDPDYENDTLTPLGHKQARALSRLLADAPIRAVYSSPYGRAQDTARYTADCLGLPIETLPWVREMTDVNVPSELRDDLAVWHIPPARMWALDTGAEGWMDDPIFKNSLLKARMNELALGAGELLASVGLAPAPGGYTLQGSPPPGDLAIFCHQGAGLTLAAHLLNIAPPTMWRSCYIAPTSVTTLLLEESTPGFASFRMLAMGDTSHLAKAMVECKLSGLLYNTD